MANQTFSFIDVLTVSTEMWHAGQSQGDQIGRISARLVSVYFLQFIGNCRSSQKISFSKKSAGQHVGQFFTKLWPALQERLA
jgi:hypothetical protein